jgi:hypothetical protein
VKCGSLLLLEIRLRAFLTTMGTRLTGKYLNDATAKDELVKRLKV